MIALCPNCHGVKHFGFSQLQGKGEQALQHFMKVNKLSRTVAEKEITKSFKIWQERSKNQWRLDISHLETYGIDVKTLLTRKSK